MLCAAKSCQMHCAAMFPLTRTLPLAVALIVPVRHVSGNLCRQLKTHNSDGFKEVFRNWLEFIKPIDPFHSPRHMAVPCFGSAQNWAFRPQGPLDSRRPLTEALSSLSARKRGFYQVLGTGVWSGMDCRFCRPRPQQMS